MSQNDLANMMGADIVLAIIKSFGPLEIIPWYALYWGIIGIIFMGAINRTIKGAK